ncbi:MAG: S9 family peptidase [Proteobacteria bacterium]|nr:S9 family peptidase [Pseudomonadota bacterium]
MAGLLMLSVADVHAAVHAVAEGEVPKLGPNDGLLVINVETPERVSSLHFNRPGRYVDGDSIDDIQPGRTTRLFVATAGSYQWNDIEYDTRNFILTFRMGNDPEARFEVKPGVVNYPGDLIYYPNGMRAGFRIINRGLLSIDWINTHDSGVLRQYSFEYTGHYADPFPDFYRSQLDGAAVSHGGLDQSRPAPAPTRLPIPVGDLWKPLRVGSISLSPNGNLLAEEIYEDGKRRIDVVDLDKQKVAFNIKLDAGVRSIDWVGNHAFAVSLQGEHAYFFDKIYFVRLFEDRKNGLSFDAINVPYRVKFIGALPGDSGLALLESSNGNGGVMVHRVDVHAGAASMNYHMSYMFKIDRGVPDAIDWMSDGAGALRAALVRRNGKLMLLHEGGGKFVPAITDDKDDEDQQYYLSNDGNTFYMVTDHGRAQRDLVAFDTTTKATTTLFSKPGVDVDEPVFDTRRRLLGVRYHANGVAVVEYFNAADRGIVGHLGAAFPGARVNIIERSDSGKRFIVSVEKSDQPAKIYFYDADTAVAELLEDSAPWLRDRHLAASQTIHATGSDGASIEAYLTMPPGVQGRSPLIVYSHGGPIGIRDDIGFDPAVQLFASLGYAVLQVNFRGSDGYGRAFREAGRHQYGSLIEDDIDAATRVVLRDFPVDGSRLCVVGASYGGYSALVSAIRWPQRFRCAISISGVSDQMLMFTASDTAQSDEGRKALETAIGNPIVDAATMREFSPLYRYKELTLPVMFAHGTKDVRVDYEHTRRMVRMLNLAGRPPVLMTFEGEGHGNFSASNENAMWTGIAGFLEANLDFASSTTATPATH